MSVIRPVLPFLSPPFPQIDWQIDGYQHSGKPTKWQVIRQDRHGWQAGRQAGKEDRACGQVCGQQEEEQCESKIGWSRMAFANTLSLGEQK